MMAISANEATEMNDHDDVDETVKQDIKNAVQNVPLGHEDAVQCRDCGSRIRLNTRVKGYVIGNPQATYWDLWGVMHSDCGSRFSAENLDKYDETDALVTALLVYDPAISDGGPDEMQVTESEEGIVLTAPLGPYRLTNPEIQAVSTMSEERRREKAETNREVEEMIDSLMSGEPLGDVFPGSIYDESRN